MLGVGQGLGRPYALLPTITGGISSLSIKFPTIQFRCMDNVFITIQWLLPKYVPIYTISCFTIVSCLGLFNDKLSASIKFSIFADKKKGRPINLLQCVQGMSVM